MRERKDLFDEVIEQIDVCMQKMQDIKDSANRVALAKDFARQTKKTLIECIQKIEAIEERASKERR